MCQGCRLQLRSQRGSRRRKCHGSGVRKRINVWADFISGAHDRILPSLLSKSFLCYVGFSIYSLISTQNYFVLKNRIKIMGWFWDPFSSLASLAIDKIGTVQLNQWPKSAWNLFIQSLEEPFRTWLSSCNHLGVVLRPFQKVGFYPFLILFFAWTMVIWVHLFALRTLVRPSSLSF